MKSSSSEVKSLNVSNYALTLGIISFAFPASILLAMIPILSFLSSISIIVFLFAGLIGPLVLGIISLRLIKYIPEKELSSRKVRWARLLAILGVVLNSLLLILLLVIIVNGVSLISKCSENPSLPECSAFNQLLNSQNVPTQ